MANETSVKFEMLVLTEEVKPVPVEWMCWSAAQQSGWFGGWHQLALQNNKHAHAGHSKQTHLDRRVLCHHPTAAARRVQQHPVCARLPQHTRQPAPIIVAHDRVGDAQALQVARDGLQPLGVDLVGKHDACSVGNSQGSGVGNRYWCAV